MSNIKLVTCNDMTFAFNNTRTFFPCEKLWVCTKILLGNSPVTVYKSLAFQSFAAPMQNSTGCTGLNGISIRSLLPPHFPLSAIHPRATCAACALPLYLLLFLFFPILLFRRFSAVSTFQS